MPLAFELDNSLPKLAADGVIVIFIALNAYVGWRAGLVRRILAFGGSYLGALAATNTGNSLASLIGGHDVNTNAWAFVLVFLIIIVGIETVGYLYRERINKLIVVSFDRITGLIAGIVLAFFEVGILFLISINTSGLPGSYSDADVHGISADAVRHSTLGEYVVKAESAIQGIYGPVLPNNLAQHLNENRNSPNS